MKPMTLNMSKMSKIAGDKKSSTFKHEDGHTMIIVHGALTPLQRKQIEKMPLCEGGAVLPKHMHPPKDPKMEAVPRLAMAEGGQALNSVQQAEADAKDAVRKRHDSASDDAYQRGDLDEANRQQHQANASIGAEYAQGGAVNHERGINLPTNEKGVSEAGHLHDKFSESPQDKHSAKEKHRDVLHEMGKIHPKLQGLAEGGPVKMYADPQEPVSADDSAPVATDDSAPVATDDSAPAAKDVNINVNPTPAPTLVATPGSTQPPAPAMATPGVNPAVTMAQKDPMQGVQMPVVPAGRPVTNPDGTMNPSAVAENAQSAVKAQADIEKAQGQAAANRIAGYNQAQAQIQQDIQNKYNTLSMHTDQYANYMNSNPPDPDHYMRNMSDGRKVRTAIGLFLGGLGGGIAHTGGNAALDYLKMQITNDIQAQKDAKEDQKTIYGAYKSLYGEGIAADNSTKATMLDIANQQVQQVAGQLNTPISQQKALQFGAATAIEKSKLLQDAAVNLGSLPGNRPNTGAPSSGSGGHSMPPARNGKVGPEVQGLLDKNRASQNSDNAHSVADSDHILAPGATKILLGARFGDKNPFTKDYEKVERQLQAASMADKTIDKIKEHFPQMYKNISENPDTLGNSLADAYNKKWGQISGYVHRKGVNMEDIPYVGPLVGGSAKAVTDTQHNREYDIHRGAVKSQLISTLTHAGIAPTQADEILNDYWPEVGDTPQMAQNKMKIAIEKVRDAVPRDALERHPELLRKSK